MNQPAHHLIQAGQARTRGQCGAVDHNHRQTQFAGRIKLGARARAAGILGHHMGNRVLAHQVQIAPQVEGTSGDMHMRIGKRQGRFGWIDQPQQVGMPGLRGKSRQMLLSNGQKDPGGLGGQRRHRTRKIPDMAPAIMPGRDPGGPLKSAKGHIRCLLRGNCISAHPCREGMRGINHVGNLLGAEIRNQPRNTAKAPNPRGQGLRHRRPCPSGIGKNRLHPGLGQCARQDRGLGRAAQKKDACHG